MKSMPPPKPELKPGQLVSIREYSYWFKTAELISWNQGNKMNVPKCYNLKNNAVGLVLRYTGDKGRCPDVQSSSHYWEVLVGETAYDIAANSIWPVGEEEKEEK